VIRKNSGSLSRSENSAVRGRKGTDLSKSLLQGFCDGGGGGDSLDYSREISTESSGEVDFTRKTNTRAYPSDLIHSSRGIRGDEINIPNLIGSIRGSDVARARFIVRRCINGRIPLSEIMASNVTAEVT